jgi:hypothetical protein
LPARTTQQLGLRRCAQGGVETTTDEMAGPARVRAARPGTCRSTRTCRGHLLGDGIDNVRLPSRPPTSRSWRRSGPPASLVHRTSAPYGWAHRRRPCRPRRTRAAVRSGRSACLHSVLARGEPAGGQAGVARVVPHGELRAAAGAAAGGSWTETATSTSLAAASS